jgi:hypothetical protein
VGERGAVIVVIATSYSWMKREKRERKERGELSTRLCTLVPLAREVTW